MGGGMRQVTHQNRKRKKRKRTKKTYSVYSVVMMAKEYSRLPQDYLFDLTIFFLWLNYKNVKHLAD